MSRIRRWLSTVVPRIDPYPIDRWVLRVQTDDNPGWRKSSTVKAEYPELAIPIGVEQSEEPITLDRINDRMRGTGPQPVSGTIKCVPLYRGRGGQMGPAAWTRVFYDEEKEYRAQEGQTVHRFDREPDTAERVWPYACGIAAVVMWAVLEVALPTAIPVLGLDAVKMIVTGYAAVRLYSWGKP